MDYNKVNFKENNRNIIFERRFCFWVHRRFFRKPGILCDVGSGTGNNSIAFKKLGYEVHAFDFDDIYFKRLNINGIDTKKIDLNSQKLPFKKSYLDYIFAKSIIEHLSEPLNFLSEANKCLKIGGRIFILTPNWKEYYKNFFDDPTHKSPFTIISLRKALLMSGFKIINIRRFRNFPYIWKFFRNFPFEYNFLFPKEIIAVAEKIKDIKQ